MVQPKMPKAVLKQANIREDGACKVHASGESTAVLTSSEEFFGAVHLAQLYPRRGAMKHIIHPKAYRRNAHICFNAPLGVNKMFGINARASAHAKAKTCVRLTKKRSARC